ncbi:MAG: alpha/beta fold hydrolase [Pseudomonadota bacterium]
MSDLSNLVRAICKRGAAILATALVAPTLAASETVQIPGPEGPLEGEQIAVDGARSTVVIVPGSGPTDRNGNSNVSPLQSDTYKLLAEELAAAGIASIRIDKRGFFGSQGAIADPNDVTVSAYASDVLGWLDFAADQGAACTWIAGHSEGGLVALAAAQMDPDGLCGIVLLAAPGRPVGDLLLEQVRRNPANAPFMAEIESLVAQLSAGHTRDVAKISPELLPLFSEGPQRFMADLFSYDPAGLARDWAGPTLIVQGDADVQVAKRDADLLQSAFKRPQRLDLDGGTHMLKQDVPGQPFATYVQPELPLHPDLVEGIAAFISAKVPRDTP